MKLKTFSIQGIPWGEFDPEKLSWENQWIDVSVMWARGKRHVFVNGKFFSGQHWYLDGLSWGTKRMKTIGVRIPVEQH